MSICFSVFLLAFNIQGTFSIYNYQYYCIHQTYIIAVGFLFGLSLIKYLMTRVIFNRILKNYLNHEKFFSEGENNTKSHNRKSKKHSLETSKNRIESINSINLRKSLLNNNDDNYTKSNKFFLI